MQETRYAYLHGFASSSRSAKGTRLAASFAARGLSCVLPDLNEPSFAELTYTGALKAFDAVDALAPQHAWCLIGSSMGGYLAARWAALNPDKVARLVLLCPGFHMTARWPEMLGEAVMTRWRQEGFMEIPDATGTPTPVSWELVADADRHPGAPENKHPTLIIHGRQDEIVPIGQSRDYAQRWPGVRLLEVDDDHRLMNSVAQITAAIFDFFELGESS